MAVVGQEFAVDPLSSLVPDGSQETSYVFIKSLGFGAFAEANLYRKVEVNIFGVGQGTMDLQLGENCIDNLGKFTVRYLPSLLFILNHNVSGHNKNQV